MGEEKEQELYLIFLVTEILQEGDRVNRDGW
jgi:hypothetical protein